MPEAKDVYWLIGRAGEIALDPSQKFWKELIREGRWTNARAGFTLDVDRSRLASWKRNFDAMLDAGIRVPVPWGHSYDPRDNAGFVDALELRDRGLWGLLHVPESGDAQKLGRTVCGVSVSINPNFIDGSGRRWGEVIEHVALTNYPVVVDQGDFIQASTQSGEAARAIALELSHDAAPAELAAVAKHLGLGDVTREDAAASIRLKFDALNAELEHCRTELVELRAQKTNPDEQQRPDETKTVEVKLSSQAADPAGAARNSELSLRLCTLERERAEREVDEAMRLGRFSRPAAEALRQLVAAGLSARYAFDSAAASTGGDIAALARQIIANTPDGAALDMAEHTRLHVIPDPSHGGMTEAKAAKLAKENRELAGL